MDHFRKVADTFRALRFTNFTAAIVFLNPKCPLMELLDIKCKEYIYIVSVSLCLYFDKCLQLSLKSVR